MFRPPLVPRQHRIDEKPTLRGVLASLVVVAAIPLLFWTATHPLAGAVTLAAVVGLAIVVLRALRLLRCLVECGGFAVDLGDAVRIRVTRPEACGPGC